jgi:hypothetical protein
MAISNYSELQAAVTDWLARSDLAAGTVQNLIALAEAGFKRRLRVRAMELRATASTVAGQPALALPGDFLEMRNLRINTDPRRTLLMVPPHGLDWEEPESTALGVPRIYKVVGSELVFGPVPDGAYTVEMDYYAFPVLSVTQTTNWLLIAHPDAYLFGALLAAADYVAEPADSPRRSFWALRHEATLAEIRASDQGERWNGAPLIVRTDTMNP